MDDIIAYTIDKLMVEAERRFAFCQLSDDGRAYTAGEATRSTLDEACGGGKSSFLYAGRLVRQLHGHLFSGSREQSFSNANDVLKAAREIINELIEQLKERIDDYEKIVAFRMEQADRRQIRLRGDLG